MSAATEPWEEVWLGLRVSALVVLHADEWAVNALEIARLRSLEDSSVFLAVLTVFLGMGEEAEGREPGLGMIRSPQSRKKGADAPACGSGTLGVGAPRQDVDVSLFVSPDGVGEGTDHRHLVGPLREAGEGSPESDPGQGSLNFAHHAVVGGGGVHVGVEGLDVTGSAGHVEKNHRLVPDEVDLGIRGQGASGEKIGQGEASKAQSPNPKEIPSGEAFAIPAHPGRSVDPQHE